MNTLPTAAVANPTARNYGSLNAAYEHFNRTLFAGELPPCLITLTRHHGAYGYFCGDRMASLDDGTNCDEIALNPMYFLDRGPKRVLSTLVHEMVHLWQHHFGKRPRRCYHDKQFAAKMLEVGLVPSDTGKPGGKQTGQHMTHYIEPGGPFDRYCSSFLGESRGGGLYHDMISLAQRAKARKERKKSRTKFTCPGCQLTATAKLSAHLVCGDCEARMIPEVCEDDD